MSSLLTSSPTPCCRCEPVFFSFQLVCLSVSQSNAVIGICRFNLISTTNDQILMVQVPEQPYVRVVRPRLSPGFELL